MTKRERLNSALVTSSFALKNYMNTILDLEEEKKYKGILLDILCRSNKKTDNKYQTASSWEYGMELSAPLVSCQTEWAALQKELQEMKNNGIMEEAVLKFDKKVYSRIAPYMEKAPEEDIQKHQRRNNNIYRRSEFQGLYVKKISDIVTNERPVVQDSLGWQLSVRYALSAILRFGWYDAKYPSDITKTEWLEACDLVGDMLSPLASVHEEMSSDAKSCYAEISHMLMVSYGALIHTIHSLADHSVDTVDAASAESKRVLQEQSAEIQRLKEQLEQQDKVILDLKKQLAAVPTVDTQVIKATTELAHTHQEEVREKDAYIAYLESQISALQSAPVETAQDQEQSAPWKDIQLPEANVLFLGGHKNLVKKIAGKYPSWTYISDKDQTKNPPSNPEVFFFWSGHCSHKLFFSILNRIPPNTTILYLTATNMDLLEDEMRQKYWSYKQEQRQKVPEA
jgi:hypothetical protein